MSTEHIHDNNGPEQMSVPLKEALGRAMDALARTKVCLGTGVVPWYSEATKARLKQNMNLMDGLHQEVEHVRHQMARAMAHFQMEVHLNLQTEPALEVERGIEKNFDDLCFVFVKSAMYMARLNGTDPNEEALSMRAYAPRKVLLDAAGAAEYALKCRLEELRESLGKLPTWGDIDTEEQVFSAQEVIESLVSQLYDLRDLQKKWHALPQFPIIYSK